MKPQINLKKQWQQEWNNNSYKLKKIKPILDMKDDRS